jgi:phosphohistidine phosphatase
VVARAIPRLEETGNPPTETGRPPVGGDRHSPADRRYPPVGAVHFFSRIGLEFVGMLWLLRHAEAADGQPDEERPLTERGVLQAEAAGRALARLGERIDVCLSSPKRRALQTAELACEQLGIPVIAEPALAGEPFDVAAVTAGHHNLLLVGHDPSFSLLVHDLTGTQARMKKGGLAAISKGELVAFLRPTDLAAIAETAAVASG